MPQSLSKKIAVLLKSLILTALIISLQSQFATGGEPSPKSIKLTQKWPQFRGPGGQGHSDAILLPKSWNEKQNVSWKTPLPGQGWSSPVIENGMIWMTSSTQKAATKEEIDKKLAKNTGSQPLTIVGEVTFWALGVEFKSGKLVHEIKLFSRKSPDPVHTLNSFASPTPIIEDGKLYCHFGTNGTACLDTQKKEVVWINDDVKINHENGPGSSPTLWKDKLIFHCDGSDKQYILALYKKNGEQAWKTDRSGKMHPNPQLKKAYGTPIVTKINGKPHLLSPASDWLYAYNPDNGDELWKLNYETLGFSIVPRPVLGHGKAYMCTSFMRSQLLAIDLQSSPPKIAWRHKRGVPNMPSPILVGDEIYFTNDKGGILTCLNAKTGDVHFKERLGGNFSASPLYADGKLFFSNREGKTFVIQPGKEFKLLSTNELDGAHFASIIALQSSLIVRTDKAIYRIQGASKAEIRR